MKSRLSVLVPEHWPQAPECEWHFTDRDGQSAQRGRSAPKHWPQADEHVAILDGAQTNLLSLTVPPSKRKDRPALINYALEAQLARDIDQEHVTIVADLPGKNRVSDDAHCLIVIVASTARLRQISAQFDALQRPLHRVVSIFECLNVTADTWQMMSADGVGIVLRTREDSGIAFDLGLPEAHAPADPVTALADLLHLALSDPAGGVQPPARLEMAITPPLTPEACASLEQQTGISIHPVSLDAIWARSPHAHSLLHGTLAPKVGNSANLWSVVRWPALTAGAALSVAGLVTAASVLSDRADASHLEQRQHRVFADALPGTPAIAPVLQLRRALRDARHSHGELAEDDLLALLGALTEVTGNAPEAFTYRDHRLSVELAAAPASLAALERRGFKVAVDGRQITLSLQP